MRSHVLIPSRLSSRRLTAGPAASAAGQRVAGERSAISPEFKAHLVRAVAAVLSGFGLFILTLSFEPFPGDGTDSAAASGGNVINQVGYLGLGGLFLFALLSIVDPRLLLKAITPTFVIIFAIAFGSCLQSYDPATSARGVMQSLIVMIPMAGVLLLPRSERDFVEAGATAILLLVLLNYAMLVLAPSLAKHTADAIESWHAGFWRGHLSHKNVAAPVFSILCMFGIYCARTGAPRRGLLIALLSANFVLHTGSKTTIGFLPLSILFVGIGALTLRPALTIALHTVFTIVILALTLGSVYFSSLHDLTASLMSDPTFTGRNDIWDFASRSIPDHPWFGHGYASFWQSPVILGMEKDFEANWDVRGIVTAHNVYLDAVVTYGFIGGLPLLALFFIKPFFDYARAFRRPQNRHFAEFCIMVVAFMTYNGMMESFLINRADPLWVLTALAVYGLNLAAAAPVAAEEPAADGARAR
ncbi:hypothetical protein BTR14_02915 [Rhizobium rhizosphaerae]|uniref:O-antigen ligase-related domain-containing protein n=1 Tax=Xaviernesmea rhizosphaerae TaxID=1672749 RepID=A0ABX3PJP1_9HYPH|nr:O-antigen ligase [Xaviernesmea rhizosphaerae]OQP88396.1 hypothetical protein BTR14_02915 [Xaviernesmea rhizosphaerae]